MMFRSHLILIHFVFVLFASSSCTAAKQVATDIGSPVELDENEGEIKVDESRVYRYISSIYLYVFGRKPSISELNTWHADLQDHHFDQQTRERFVSALLDDEAYLQYTYRIAEADLLNFIFDPDTAQIQITIDVWDKLLENEKLPPPFVNHIQAEIAKLQKLKDIPEDLLTGISQVELHKRLTFNSYYDFVNMGTENFVVSMFQNFLNRYPSVHELEQGKQMVDGFGGTLFLTNGQTKSDFVDIFFNSLNYHEGQIRILFDRYLNRKPTEHEIVQYTVQYYHDRDFKKIQHDILSTIVSDTSAALLMKNSSQLTGGIYSDIKNEILDIPSQRKLQINYESFGDEWILQDIMIRSLLNSDQRILPSIEDMKQDVPLFIKNTFLKLLNRKPSEEEAAYLEQLINEDPAITPEILYYSIFTSKAYQLY